MGDERWLVVFEDIAFAAFLFSFLFLFPATDGNNKIICTRTAMVHDMTGNRGLAVLGRN